MSQEATSSTPQGPQVFNAIIPGTSQMVVVGASSAASTATQSTTTVVEVCATVACFIQIGTTPVAVANTSCYLPAATKRLYGITPGQQIAVIQATSGGNLYITEGA
jgi:hypothetical protein